jgi:2-keto-4-pentenoate hydratase
MTSRLPLQARSESLAQRFALARARRTPLDTLPEDARPANQDEAYAAQFATLDLMQEAVAGWKVGAKSPGGAAQCAPLPASCVHRSGAPLARREFGKAGLELELAFSLGRRFEPAGAPYADQQVLDAIVSVHATIEIVSSRFNEWPNVDKLWQLADLQNHGALIVGEGVAYQRLIDGGFSFETPAMRFTLDDAAVSDGTPANPAGDPRWLLPWLVNHGISRGVIFEPGTVLTTGSYTGMFFPDTAGVLHGAIEGLPPVQLTLT